MTQKYYLSEKDKDKPELQRYFSNGTDAKGFIIQKEMAKEARLRALALVEFILFLHKTTNNMRNDSPYIRYRELLSGVLEDLKIANDRFENSSAEEIFNSQQKTLLAIRRGLQISLQRNPIIAIFEDMAEFIGGTKLGPLLSFGIILAGVTVFIVLTQQYNMGAVGGYTFLASVFGTFFIDMGASQVYKHYGLFKEKPALYIVDDIHTEVEFARVSDNPQI